MAGQRLLNVFLDGTFVGQTHQSPQGALRFVYDDDYLADPEATQ